MEISLKYHCGCMGKDRKSYQRVRCRGVARGKGGKSPPPETEKIDVENGVIFQRSIFSNKFSKK